MQKHTILCVDDEIDNVEALERLFRKKYTVLTSSSATEALEILKHQEDIAVILTDQRMPHMTGVELLEQTLTQFPHTSRILLTGYSDLESVISAVNQGQIFRYIPKPWEPVDLLNTVDQAVHKYEITKELFEKNKELAKAYDELKSLDVAKNNFMILINHELRTPLTAILSFTDLLKESALDEDQNKMISRIQQSADRLKNLIEDVLLIVRAETRQLKLDFQKNTITQIDECLTVENKKLIQQKQLRLSLNLSNAPCLCDIRLVRQILMRLIHNACKFSPDHSEISIRSVALENKVRFLVSNQGSSISQKIIDRVYNPFYIDENIMNHSTGMGLGLSICQAILKLHQSKLQIDNTPQGVSVYFDI